MAKGLTSLRRVGLAIFLLVHAVVYRLIAWFGYTFVPVNAVLQVGIALVLIIALMIDGIGWSDDQTKFSSIVNAMLPVIALFFVTSYRGSFGFFLSIATVICSMVLFFAYTQNRKVKIILGAIYALILALPLLFASFALLGAIFLPISAHTEIRQIELSPSGMYLAELTENNQGMLGGATWIDVTRQDGEISILIGTFRPHPQNIYSGRWAGSQYMVLRWETDGILYITHIEDPEHIIMRFERQWHR